MLSLVHTPTGAFLASKLPHPLLYIPLAVAVHILQDWIPHWDVGKAFAKHPKKKYLLLWWGLLDLAIGYGLVFWWWQHSIYDTQWHIWIGATAGLLPDFIQAPRTFLGYNIPVLRNIDALHKRYHQSTNQIVPGLLPQLYTLGLLYWLR